VQFVALHTKFLPGFVPRRTVGSLTWTRSRFIEHLSGTRKRHPARQMRQVFLLSGRQAAWL